MQQSDYENNSNEGDKKTLLLKNVRMITFAPAIHFTPNSKHNSYRNNKNQVRRKNGIPKFRQRA